MKGPRVGGVALVMASLSALSACASNDQAKRAVVEVATVHARVDETTATANATARDVAALESRVRVLEGQLAQSDRELLRARGGLGRMREELASRPATPAIAAAPAPPSTPAAARAAAPARAGEAASAAAAGAARSPAGSPERPAPDRTAPSVAPAASAAPAIASRPGPMP